MKRYNVKFNNIMVEHHGTKISIAQHFHSDKVVVQEAQIIGGNLDGHTWTFNGSLTGLSGVLSAIEEDLNINSNKEGSN